MAQGEKRNRQFPNKVNTTTMVKLLVLYLLLDRSYYGNELIDEIEKIMEFRWRPSPGMIYPLLRNMEDNLLIEGWWDEPDKKTKRHYRITDTGKTHYERIKAINKPQFIESIVMINCILNTVYK